MQFCKSRERDPPILSDLVEVKPTPVLEEGRRCNLVVHTLISMDNLEMIRTAAIARKALLRLWMAKTLSDRMTSKLGVNAMRVNRDVEINGPYVQMMQWPKSRMR